MALVAVLLGATGPLREELRPSVLPFVFFGIVVVTGLVRSVLHLELQLQRSVHVLRRAFLGEAQHRGAKAVSLGLYRLPGPLLLAYHLLLVGCLLPDGGGLPEVRGHLCRISVAASRGLEYGLPHQLLLVALWSPLVAMVYSVLLPRWW